ncbi:hypothetical protein AVDCRST_MAG84-2645 [uncultured Microcoleus sp.]|uniref:Uncharacterized protein n=1 Tax=uncultured Microcoleus sp. TaxID=259945 RepID=A0A6J4M1C3_9CYAN|nr:hypothetical protein AVDCRST_MAG84-2645 [uncultured Microcoleus sp.]
MDKSQISNLKSTKAKTRVGPKIGVSIKISCSAFKLYVSRRGGKSVKSSRLLPLSRSPRQP